jgi:hypothetical protein
MRTLPLALVMLALLALGACEKAPAAEDECASMTAIAVQVSNELAAAKQELAAAKRELEALRRAAPPASP